MREEMRRDLVDAIARGDHVAVSVLRAVLAAIDRADAATPGLAPADVERVVAAQIDLRTAEARQHAAAGDREATARLREEAALLRGYTRAN